MRISIVSNVFYAATHLENAAPGRSFPVRKGIARAKIPSDFDWVCAICDRRICKTV